MSDSAYMNALQEQFSDLRYSNFIVQFMPPIIFVCGGPMNALPMSVRDHIFTYVAGHNPILSDSLVLAENFHDYFKDGAYSDLMSFEDDIANISTLVVICLESAGSLVELGLFVNKKSLAQKLHIVAPLAEIEGNEEKKIPPRSSFIYLGPLEYLKRIDDASVSVYPWPKSESMKYDEVELIYHDIYSRLKRVKKTERYNTENTGYLAILIYEIILLSEPIKKTEIEWALYCMDIDVPQKIISRLLYLLSKMNLTSSLSYSGTDYYYSRGRRESKLKFGISASGKIKDSMNIKVAIRQSYLSMDTRDMDETAKKRKNALSQINIVRGGA
ncbi:retron St85 family effector protein [Klebsiella quasipneumoniae]|uniref:retron St85 family effector protein n=4 Tax=Klebsiella quasipneumoniae TaxID=1463165 RepID=UPI001CFA3834|nr:retron St85 family effector protein [Klebsiella quasipneumoniae]MDO0743692.1 retron St85 family effector protein [Klebsiella quasipneumoniae]MDZ1778057.1 retron St85 family effector protein [Klebsiella quasipneumoniae]